ncbi:unnamed protein product [Ambrosiozyma monospora]|uniref:Unnamed protein product n=1 Tax=Ambrosiozyma monospora TaxID=43982 RepID=A0ACB5T5C4_AMBMO|nr:unnamed protein product [Ambrosiozyma monospora]
MNHTHSKKCFNGGGSSSSSQGSSHGGTSTSSSRRLVINNQDLIFEHFLPSFEMHNYMFNRTLLDTEYIRDERNSPPPSYQEQTLEQPGTADATGPPDHVSPEARVARFVDPTMNPDMLVLNNLDTLQTLNLPIKLTIVLTKKLPLRNVCSERETPLKVYKPGDIVTGYTLIENISKDPIPFEMFLVSLEGTATTNPNSKGADANKITRNSFLKMYDLCACHHYGTIDVGPTADRCGEVCPETGAEYGLSDDKILKPGKKYKKLFMFKIPTALLDTACEHQSPEHLGLPSSFGVDAESFNGESGRIQINKNFGYGHLGLVGSPIRTNDLSAYGQSISYSINVRMIGRQLDFYKKFYNKKTDHDFDFIFIQDVQHFFRVSTAGETKNINHDSAWYFKSNFSSDEQVEQLEKLCNDITEKLELQRDLIAAGVTDTSEQQAIMNTSTDAKKIYQLESARDQERLTDHTRIKVTKSKDKNVVENVTAATLTKGLFNKIETGELDITLSTNKKNSIDSIVPEVLQRMSVADTVTKSTGIDHLDVIQQNKSSSSKPHDAPTLGSKSLKSSSKSASKKSESIFESLNTIRC